MSMVKIKKVAMLNIGFENGMANSEDTAYSSYEADKGFGNIASVTGRVQKGAKVTAEVNIAMNVVTADTIKSVFNTHKSKLDERSRHEVEHHLEENNSCSGLWGFFAGFRSHRDKTEWERETNIKETVSDSEDKEILRDIYNMVSTNVMVTGNIEIVGMSFIPTEASLYVKVCTIDFEDGKTLQVIDSSPVAFSKDGDVSKVQVPASSKLKIKQFKN
ncbi:hypothetical protein [Klebsiella pneumoniae]|uniref:hypothetical protein n=1 Tax=Klebsiella pneumoniae TaxID=573 RepID=UPI001E53DB94|nr:hypothetical protein [Klebsiella pneumoniae]MCE3583848.1 hypothetical protein [Klebsiella pneumoniae]HBY8809789.1 hypothetical protein [Klebsiella pneumoniae]HBY9898314.1 hypothetical protein [Klebsiella pneumoniae]HBY9947207.1 hypothetical protein [Klebsiella pneumoniae]HCA9653488.1 hypothetical protein [Klebsiella pneumoniae]